MGLKVNTDNFYFWPSLKICFLPAVKNRIHRNQDQTDIKIHFFGSVPKSPIQTVSLSAKNGNSNIGLLLLITGLTLKSMA